MSDSQPQGEVMPPIEGERAHESTEIAAKSIVLFALGLVVLAVAVHFSLGLVMGRFAGQESKIVASRPPLFAAAVDYSGPHLQGDPAADRLRSQQQQLEQLSSYGWVDRNAKIAHIPIDRAMDLLAESSDPELLSPEKRDAGTTPRLPGDPEARPRPADRQGLEQQRANREEARPRPADRQPARSTGDQGAKP